MATFRYALATLLASTAPMPAAKAATPLLTFVETVSRSDNAGLQWRGFGAVSGDKQFGKDSNMDDGVHRWNNSGQ